MANNNKKSSKSIRRNARDITPSRGAKRHTTKRHQITQSSGDPAKISNISSAPMPPSYKSIDKSIDKRRANSLKILLLLALIFIIGIFATAAIYLNYYLMDYREVNTSVKVVLGVSGINTDADALRFGRMAPGGGGTRYFKVYTPTDARIRIKTTGLIGDWITLSDYDFILKANQTHQVTADISIPLNTTLGNYSGKIQVFYYRTW